MTTEVQPSPSQETSCPHDVERRQAIRRLGLTTLIPALVIGAIVALSAQRTNLLPYQLLTGISIVAAVAGLLTLVLLRTNRLQIAPLPAAAAALLSLPVISFSISDLGVFLGVSGVLILPRALQPAFAEENRQRYLYLGLVSGVVAVLIDLFQPAGRLQLPVPEAVVLGLNVILVILFLLRVAGGYSSYRLRTKLLLAFLAVSIIPLGTLAFLNNQSTRSSLRQEANQRLIGAASQLTSRIDTFVVLNERSVSTTARMLAFENYLSLDEDERSGSAEERMAESGLTAHSQLDPTFVVSYGLLDLDGTNVLDSEQDLVGQSESDRDYFQAVVSGQQSFSSAVQIGPGGEPALYFSAPIRDSDGDLLGVLRAHWDARVLQQMVDESTGLAGPESFAVLFDEHYLHVAHSNRPGHMLTSLRELEPDTVEQLQADHRLPSEPMDELVTHLHDPDLVQNLVGSENRSAFEASDPESPDQTLQAAVVETESQPWQVVFFQPQDVLFAPAREQAQRTLLVSLLIINGVALAALGIASLLARPITRLTEAAQKVADGDLDAEADVTSEDELGILAGTFNAMTQRLRELVVGLEDRVSERTEDLERRAQQLQAAADVAKDAAAVQQVDELLDEVVQRIQDRFGHYHAAVFLLDDDGDQAVLRAASSPGGKRMLARGHKLAVGKVGLVGYVTGTGKARVALDVGEDAIHFANPDLPDTRSEVALPLMTGGRIIGALDVQSREADAFDDQDVVALQTMADQLAIAIENARLLAQQTELAADRRRAIDVYRRLSQSMSYDQVLADSTRLIRSTFGFDRVTLGLTEGSEVVIRSASAGSQGRLPRLGQSVPVGQGLLGRAVSTSAPVRQDDSTPDSGARADPILGELEASLSVPLISRGEAIGALAVERLTNRVYNESDIELLELLASQAAVSIENARLFEETQHRLRQVDALYRRQTSEAWELLVNARRVQGEENRAAFGEDEDEVAREGDPIETSISLRGEVIGKLDVLPQRPDEWTDEDLEILQDVAEEVAGQLEQLRLVEEIQRRATQLETAAEIARVATGLLDLDPLLKRAVNLIRERFGFYHVAVYLVEGDGNTAFIREASGEIGEALKQTRRRFEVGSRTVIGFATGSGEYYVAHDTETDPFYRPSDLLPESGSELAVPLKIGDRAIGALDVHDKGRYAFSEDDIVVLETLADQIAVAVENARLFQEALRRAEREQSVVQITSKIRASKDIDSILRTAVEEMRQALGAREATIRLAPVPAEIGDNGRQSNRTEASTDSTDGRTAMPPAETEA